LAVQLKEPAGSRDHRGDVRIVVQQPPFGAADVLPEFAVVLELIKMVAAGDDFEGVRIGIDALPAGTGRVVAGRAGIFVDGAGVPQLIQLCAAGGGNAYAFVVAVQLLPARA